MSVETRITAATAVRLVAYAADLGITPQEAMSEAVRDWTLAREHAIGRVARLRAHKGLEFATRGRPLEVVLAGL